MAQISEIRWESSWDSISPPADFLSILILTDNPFKPLQASLKSCYMPSHKDF
jgi:hypothetical protein